MRGVVALVPVALLLGAGCGAGGSTAAPRGGSTVAVATTTVGTTRSTAAAPEACADQHGALSTASVPGPGAASAIRVAVYLPPCALNGSGRRFPTVYLLHGANADETQWPAIGLATVADDLIGSRQIPPVIVVMPDSGLAAGDTTVVDRVLPWADANLPTSPQRADRAVGGISAGGAAAIELVVERPDLFSRLGGHSPVVDVSDAALDQLVRWGGAIWLDVGTGDGLLAGTSALADRLTAAGADPDLHVWPGQHDRPYWASHVADYLRFYAAA